MSELRQMITDGWANLLTNLGVIGKDKTLAATFSPDLLDQQTLENLWRGDDIAGVIVEALPEEALRQGFAVQLAEDRTSIDEAVRAAERRIASVLSPSGLDVAALLQKADEYERCYGGSAIYLGALDGRKPSGPLDENAIRSFRFLEVFEPRELRPVEWYTDPLLPKRGSPRVFEVVPIASYDGNQQIRQIHESRLVVFPGIRVSKRTYRENNGWGDSVLNRVYQVLARFNQSFDGSSILLSDFSTSILKIKGLAEILSANDRSLVANRAVALDMSRSVARTTIIDAEESYERQTTAVAGLSDLLDKWMERLAAAARMPISILFGRQPGGLNSTGQTDIERWYSGVEAHRTQDLQPRLERILRVLFRAKDGPTGGVEPESWSIVWPALRQLNESQEADRRQKIAQTDQIYYSLGAVTSDEIRRSRFGGERYSAETSIDPSVDDFRLVQNPDLPATAQPEQPQTAPTTEAAMPQQQTIELTPADLATIITVNEARAQRGLPPRPDGEVTIAEFQARNKGVIAEAQQAVSGEAGGSAPTT